MSHYEERLENDLRRLRENVAEMAEKVEAGVRNAVQALNDANSELAASTILADHAINRAMRRIDKLCHGFIAQHLPGGAHLRLLSSVIRVNIELERIGDYAVIIAREAIQLSALPSGALARELDRVGSETMIMLREALRAFNELNVEKARATMVMEEQMEHDLDLVYAELMGNGDHDSVKNLLRLFAVFTQLKRIADQAKNLCEETVFATTGEAKAPKVYNVLFVDDDDSCLAPMAVAIARKNYPGSGSYSSAGLSAAQGRNPEMVAFLEKRGPGLESDSPQALEKRATQQGHHHVIVSLRGPISTYLEEVPFHTTPLQWEVAEAPADQAAFEGWLEEVYRDLATRIRQLMEQLRGEDAP